MNIQSYCESDQFALYQCDNNLLLKELPNNHINLIYSDILYGTGRDFGEYQDIKATQKIVNDFYQPRIIEMHRVLKDNGNLILHMDDRINHWIRILCDDIFGYNNFRNEIAWCYLSGGSTRKYLPKKHEYLIWYSKSNQYTFNPIFKEYSEKTKTRNGCGFEKQAQGYGCKDEGTPIVDWWIDIEKVLNYKMPEYTGYPTQKSVALLDRVIILFSNENDIVADFFMGSGTTGLEAIKLNRQFIGCDIGDKACKISRERLQNEHS
jgi:DNA modification methylase